ncbi:F-box domain-containing protein [Mycena sanguinolenta]|uniref:F-box domain-containing protein n=1 Tax=Mycena sanguinolenta TaxID=230812 RepID=A0A8H7DBC1_9AGAR|nr:F-box domain-containing protein [Mycena sanguinolenta]
MKQCSSFLDDFISSSVELQYQIALEASHLVDNTSSTMPISDRLSLLGSREEAFASVKPSWKVSVPVTFQASGLYELSGGSLWLGERPNRTLRYIELPSRPTEEGEPSLQWQSISKPTGLGFIIDFGLAINEHDLIVMATFTPTTEDGPHGEIKLEFLTVSDPHEPHPDASGPISVLESTAGKPSVIIEIVGDHLIFGVGYPFAFTLDPPPDAIYVFNWKTRQQKLKIDAECRTYFGAIFLSPEIIMLANTAAARLELWSINNPDQNAPLLVLHLPRLVPGCDILTMTVRGEPNPQVYHRRPRRMPFHSSAENAILSIQLKFARPGMHMQNFMLFVHRHALLALLDAHAPGDSCSYTEWGPDICRWIDATRMATAWITMASGQRCVLLPQLLPKPFIMLDFNPTKLHAGGIDMPPDSDPFEGSGIWAEPVGSRLRCHYAGSRVSFDMYRGASLDDHRIIGLKSSSPGQVSGVDIYYFG